MPAAELKETEAGGKEGISPLDPDFLLILAFAIIVDIIDIFLLILKIITAFTIGMIVAVLFDMFILVVIGSWMHMRINKIAQSKKKQVATLQKTAGKKAAGMQKQLARGIKSPMRRVLTRGGAALLGEFIPIIGLIPFWTITVILTLREK